MCAELSEDQAERYSRQLVLKEIGDAGQKKLLSSSVFVVGAGGLGSSALLYLAAAGVGKIGIADHDCVGLANLQRQILHGMNDLDKSKAVSAREAIENINPDCRVELFEARLTAENIGEALRGYDVIVDGSDNFPTRFLVADCCWFEKIPLVTAAVLRFEGQIMSIIPGDSNPCYRCFVPEPPPARLVPSCLAAGVLGAVVGVMGSLQATEAIKIILGVGDTLSHRLILYDAVELSFRTLKRLPDPDCPLCGKSPTITGLVEHK